MMGHSKEEGSYIADISALGEMKPVEPLDLENYADNKEFSALPKAGRYTVQAPSEFPQAAFGRTQAGSLSIQVDPTILGPTNEGYTLRFTKVSAKTFKRSGVTVSQVGDYLRATGFRGKLPTEQDQADAVEQTANSTYQVDVDWRAYNKSTKFSLEGMERFPSDGNGGHLPWCEDPNEKDEQGNPVRLRANLNVVRFIPAI
jgi:hypothetical protein